MKEGFSPKPNSKQPSLEDVPSRPFKLFGLLELNNYKAIIEGEIETTNNLLEDKEEPLDPQGRSYYKRLMETQMEELQQIKDEISVKSL